MCTDYLDNKFLEGDLVVLKYGHTIYANKIYKVISFDYHNINGKLKYTYLLKPEYKTNYIKNILACEEHLQLVKNKPTITF